MNCAAIENILDLYAEDRLSGLWRRSVAAHLKGCAACTDKAAAFGALRRPPEAAPRVPTHLLKELHKLAERRPKEDFVPATPHARPDLSVVATAFAYAALLIIAAAVGPGVPTQSYGDDIVWEVKR